MIFHQVEGTYFASGIIKPPETTKLLNEVFWAYQNCHDVDINVNWNGAPVPFLEVLRFADGALEYTTFNNVFISFGCIEDATGFKLRWL